MMHDAELVVGLSIFHVTKKAYKLFRARHYPDSEIAHERRRKAACRQKREKAHKIIVRNSGRQDLPVRVHHQDKQCFVVAIGH